MTWACELRDGEIVPLSRSRNSPRTSTRHNIPFQAIPHSSGMKPRPEERRRCFWTCLLESQGSFPRIKMVRQFSYWLGLPRWLEIVLRTCSGWGECMGYIPKRAPTKDVDDYMTTSTWLSLSLQADPSSGILEWGHLVTGGLGARGGKWNRYHLVIPLQVCPQLSPGRSGGQGHQPAAPPWPHLWPTLSRTNSWVWIARIRAFAVRGFGACSPILSTAKAGVT